MSEKLERAIQNLRNVATKLMSLGEEPPKLAWIEGQVLTWEDIIEEMKKGTPIGLDQIEIWSRPEEEIEDEIKKAKASVKST